jgi:hypothetical protein
MGATAGAAGEDTRWREHSGAFDLDIADGKPTKDLHPRGRAVVLIEFHCGEGFLDLWDLASSDHI